MANDERVLNFVKALGVRYNAQRVVLFGSRARGDNHETSDYDVAFFGVTDNRDKLDILDAADEDAPTLKKVEISFVQDLTDKFLQNIQKEGVILYERNKT